MSKTIMHEGKEYILKSEVDNIVSSRVSKVSEARRKSESQLETLQTDYNAMLDKIKGVDALHTQIASLQDELKHSNNKYTRHSAIASHGITNPEVRDLIEYQYSKSMESKPKKDRQTLGDWLQTLKDSDDIPMILKPFLSDQKDGVVSSRPQSPTPTPTPTTTPTPIPKSNQHVQSTSDYSTNKDMLNKASTDFEYYRNNRSKIKQAYYARKGKAL